jgi:Spy/CpxP family protein refolding chaperone
MNGEATTMDGNATSRKAAVWVGLVFLLGTALGGLLGYSFAHRSYAAGVAPVGDAAKRAHKVEELTRTANLNAEQQKQLDGIVADIQAQMKSIRKTTDPQIDEVRQKGRERIRAILTTEQKPKFEEFVRKLDEERKRNSQ